jgi:putative PIN family toxin of toxin-antitoxin system
VLVSALIFPDGAVGRVYALAKSGDVDLYLSPEILKEFRAVVVGKFQVEELLVLEHLERLARTARIVVPKKRVSAIRAADADNRILECAIEAGADYIVTGDKKHILPLKKFRGIRIVSPREFLKLTGKS